MLAYALAQLGRPDEAIKVLRRLLEQHPANADAWFNLGNLLRRQRRFDEALRALRRAAQLRPEQPDASINIGYVLVQQGQFAAAEAELRASITRFPAEPDLLVNLAQLYRATRRWDEALSALERCIALAPGHGGYVVTRSLVLYESGRAAQALPDLDRLLQQHAGLPDARFARAQIRLSLGDWRGGWEDYLWRPDRLRWLSAQGHAAFARAPTAAELHGKDVLLIGEQGLGDTLFFLRFAPLLRPLVKTVGPQVDPRLAPLLDPESPPAEPVRLLVGDLPAILEAAVPPPLPLHARDDRTRHFRERLKALGAPPYVGLSWQAGTPWAEQLVPGETLSKRVPPAELGGALAGLPGTLVSLQRMPLAGEREALSAAAGRPVHDFSSVNQDLTDAAALLAALDDYVAVSNTNVHLNESLGKRTRVLLTQPAEWRWSSATWFPRALAYRQERDGSWSAALARLRADLQK